VDLRGRIDRPLELGHPELDVVVVELGQNRLDLPGVAEGTLGWGWWMGAPDPREDSERSHNPNQATTYACLEGRRLPMSFRFGERYTRFVARQVRSSARRLRSLSVRFSTHGIRSARPPHGQGGRYASPFSGRRRAPAARSGRLSARRPAPPDRCGARAAQRSLPLCRQPVNHELRRSPGVASIPRP
jgi:hypothetical protein